MPGENRTQADTIAQVELVNALRNFALVPEAITQANRALLAELTAKSFRKPSVFQSGTYFDGVKDYPVVRSSSSASLAWRALGISTVRVFYLGDADRVRISATIVDGAANYGAIMGIAFSAQDKNDVPLDQFMMVNPKNSYQGTWATPGQSFMNGSAHVSGTVDPVTGNVDENIDFANTGVTIVPNAYGPDGSANYNWGDDIEVSGNTYMHIIGSVNQVDFWTSIFSATSGMISKMWTYGLIK